MIKILLGMYSIDNKCQLLLICVILSGSCYAQSFNKMRGSKLVQAGIGFHDAGLLFNVYALKTFDPQIKAGFGGGLAIAKRNDINYKGLFLDGVGTYSLKNTRLYSINGIAGISFIADFKNEFPSDTYSKNFSFNYGILGGGEVEFIVARKLSFIVGGTYRYYLRDDFGNLRYHVFAGVRATL